MKSKGIFCIQRIVEIEDKLFFWCFLLEYLSISNVLYCFFHYHYSVGFQIYNFFLFFPSLVRVVHPSGKVVSPLQFFLAWDLLGNTSSITRASRMSLSCFPPGQTVVIFSLSGNSVSLSVSLIFPLATMILRNCILFLVWLRE